METKKDILSKWTLLIRSVIVNQRYMSLFLHLIMDNSFDLAIRLLQKKGSQVANAQKEHGDYRGGGESALMLATRLKPVSKALELIDALMYSGACMDTWEYTYYGTVFFYACRKGVDPIIFDKLIMWDFMREKMFQEWWSQYDSNGNGVFILACEGQNISLVEHVLSLAFTQHRQENFLEGKPNHILKSLFIHHRDCFDEKFMVNWLRVLRKYVDKIPQEYTMGKNETGSSDPTEEYYPHNGATLLLSGVFHFAFLNCMFDFIEEFAVLFNADYTCQELIWRWFHEKENHSLNGGRPIDKVGRYGVPVTIWKFALAHEKIELWKRNKDIALVLLRGFKAEYQSDILEHISSFVYTTALDAKARDIEKRDARYCCECKGWFVGCCICARFFGYMPGNPGSRWKSWEELRSLIANDCNMKSWKGLDTSESVKHWISWNS